MNLVVTPKALSGDTVLLNSQISDKPSLTEHAIGDRVSPGANTFTPGYINEIRKLVGYATDPGSPFWFTAFGQAIASGVAYPGSAPRIAIGNGDTTSGTIDTYDGDAYVLGNQGVNNTFIWHILREITPWSATTSPTRIIDGGSAASGVVNEVDLSANYNWTSPSAATDSNGLRYYALTGINFVTGNTETADLYRINLVVNWGIYRKTLDPASLVTHLDGTATTVQRAASGQSTLTVDGTSDVADAGAGVTTVTSAVANARITFGSDTTSITTSGANTLVVSDGVATSTSVVIDTGDATAVIDGGARPTTFLAHAVGAEFTGGGMPGQNTASYSLNRSDVGLAPTGDGSWTVTAASGSDTLSNTGFLRFSDATVQTAPSDDLMGTGTSDLLFRHDGGTVALWSVQNGAVTASTGMGSLAPGWTIDASADFTGDGTADVLFQHTTGALAVWQVQNGVAVASTGIGQLDPGWSVAGTGDFNADGTQDILFRHTGGTIAQWQMQNGKAVAASVIGTTDSNWTIDGTADFNDDGTADILFSNTVGDVALWFVKNGVATDTKTVGTLAPGWSVAGIGDFNGDGEKDILFSYTDGTIADWTLQAGQVIASSVIGKADPGWSLVGTGDYNADGTTDLLFRHTSGLYAAWEMSGGSVASVVARWELPEATGMWHDAARPPCSPVKAAS